MSVCLPKEFTDKFKAAIKDRTIDPDKLIDMSSAERRKFFEDIVGKENAEWVNGKFESKLLLKNQKAGLIDWARNVAGLKPEVRRGLLDKIEKLDKVLSPANEKSFLEDLAAQRLGISVSFEEAKKISELSKARSEAKAGMNAGGDRLAYGNAVTALENYVKDISRKPLFESFKEHPLSTTAGTAKSLKASLDNSAIFRQGWRTMFTHPGIWLKNSVKSFEDIARTMGGKAVENEVRADIVSRPNFDRMQKAKLAIGNVEEAFPTSLPEKIPGLGRLYKASENAFTGFVHRMRADVFDKYIDIMKENGIDIDDQKQLESVGKLVNSLTGRGNLGKLEPVADVVNNVFFSPRALKATIDTLTLHAGDEMTGFARKQAAINLTKTVIGIGAIIGIANALSPGSAETNPQSADFGKIKIGNTRFDITGGMASLVTLAARLLTGHSKSSTTGEVSKINSGKFGATTGEDVVHDFIDNKLSPAASVVKDFLKGQDAQGNKPTLGSEAVNFLVPLPITNYLELKKDPNSANIIAASIADALGIATNTYGSNTNVGKLEQAIQKANDSKQEGSAAPTAKSIAQQVYGTETPTSAQVNDASKQLQVYKKFGYDDKNANALNNATSETQMVQALDNAKENLGPEKFKDFYTKARSLATLQSGDVSPILISDSFDKKYKEYEKTGDFTVSGGGTLSGQQVAQRGLFDLAIAYAKAYGTDPGNAFKAMFTKETLGQVKGNLVELQRFGGIPYNAPGGSEEYISKLLKKAGISESERKNYNLEHIVPVDAGGASFDPNNLELIPRDLHNSYTKFDIALGNALKSKKMTRKEGVDLAKKLKVDKSLTVDQAVAQIKK